MRRFPPLKALYSFVAVAETGSMTQAAEALNISHSAVSQAIKSLETLVDQPLFHRIGRRVELNAAGQRYYKAVAPSLEQIVHATEALRTPSDSKRITLNMINSLAMQWWIPKVPEFQAYAPQIDVRTSNLIGQFSLEEEGVDVALIHGIPSEWQNYYCEKLADDELVLVCHPNLCQETQAISTLLQQYPVIAATNARRANDWAQWCKQHKIPVPTFSDHLTFATSAQAVQATYRQLGLLVTHRLFVKDDIQQGILTLLGHPVLHPTQGFYFVCAHERLTEENILSLRHWMRVEFGNY
ncbi:MAG: LysR family transcriptional regulator [Vibrio sp.]